MDANPIRGRHPLEDRPDIRAHLSEPVVLSADDAIHGPYPRRLISPSSFDELSGPQALVAFDEWIRGSDDGPPPADEMEGDLAVVTHLLAGAPVVFRLRDLGWDDRHSFGFVLGDYEEFVVIDLERKSLWLVAAGSD